MDSLTLDSGAGVSVWPKSKLQEVQMLPRQSGLKLVAANGSAIENIGQKIIKFRGVSGGGAHEESKDFRRRA